VDKASRQSLYGIATKQRGLFSAAQARVAGLTYHELVRAELTGEVRRVRRGVYAVEGTPRSPWDDIMAAALAAGPAAVVSHGSAAAVHRFEFAGGGEQVELTVPRAARDARSRPRGVTVHRSRDLSSLDVLVKNGVLVTSQARTLVDLTARLGTSLTEKLLDEGIISRRWSAQQVQDSLDRTRSNLPGRAELEQLLAYRLEAPLADSIFEARAYRALEPLKPYEAHYQINLGDCIYVADAAWPGRLVAAEFAGRAHRVASRSAFDRERRKLTALAAAGWKVAHLVATMSDVELLDAALWVLRSTGWVPSIPLTGKHLARFL
jgi:predicted transcriptional regulator of viral defense system